MEETVGERRLRVTSLFRFVVVLLKGTAFAAFGLLALLLVVGFIAEAGILSPFPDTDITDQKPYADFIGREYRVAVADLSAYAWNDFPDKAKILTITLTRPPGTRNRFVSYVRPLQHDQRVRIVGALRHFALLGAREISRAEFLERLAIERRAARVLFP